MVQAQFAVTVANPKDHATAPPLATMVATQLRVHPPEFSPGDKNAARIPLTPF
jgi:hypothetical protein